MNPSSKRTRLPLVLALATTLGFAAAGCAVGAAGGRSASELPLASIRLPPGFHVEVFAADVPGARSMARSPSGVLYVGTRTTGKVYAVLDEDGDMKADRVVTLASGLEMPNGVAFRDGDLYVAEVSRILRYDDVEKRLDDPPKPVVVADDFPHDRHHGWKYIAFGPDGWLYVPVGAPCNICEPRDPYASITRLKVDAPTLAEREKTREIYARGIRNTVGFTWRPGTGVLWFTDNGRDWLGNDKPPDELNRAPKAGLDFGYPYCHGGEIPDPDVGPGKGCAAYVPPIQKLGPHVASLGVKFYTGEMFPAEYRGQVFIAEHGSWNRDTPIGYRVSEVRLDGDKAVAYQPFATGWLGQDGRAWGRPVDLLVLPDGSMLVSDDKAGAIYRISYQKPAK